MSNMFCKYLSPTLPCLVLDGRGVIEIEPGGAKLARPDVNGLRMPILCKTRGTSMSTRACVCLSVCPSVRPSVRPSVCRTYVLHR